MLPLNWIVRAYVIYFSVDLGHDPILKTDEISFDLEGYLKAIEAINQIVPFDYAKSLILERNYEQLQEMKQNIATDVDKALIQYANSVNYDTINEINRLNINKIIDYGHYDKLYQGKIENCKTIRGFPIYYKPFSYKIFKIAVRV